MYQGGQIVMLYCTAVVDGVFCHGSAEFRAIEVMDSYGPRVCLDDIPLTCPRCGRGDALDIRTRSYQRSGSHPDSPYIEGDGLPYGEIHIWWLHEKNGRNRDGSYWSGCSRQGRLRIVSDKTNPDQ